MINTRDNLTLEMFPLHKRAEAKRLLDKARERSESAALFRRLRYHASASRIEEQAVQLEARALRLVA